MALKHIGQQGGIFDAARHGAYRVKLDCLGHASGARDQTMARLEADNAAERGRPDDGAAGLGADGERLRAEAPAPIRLPEGKRLEHALKGVRVLDFGWNWAGPMAEKNRLSLTEVNSLRRTG